MTPLDQAVTMPATLGKYSIEAVLGRGGMGVVYKARDPRIDRLVAIKTVTKNFTSDGSNLKRFYREAEKTGRLAHPNIIIIYELGEEEGHPYIVMEFVEGRALDTIIKSPEQPSLLHKLRIIEQVCLALGYAHTHDVIHRDVKPGNVIVRSDGVTKLLDFGIAAQEKKESDLTLTKTGTVIGTVPYMAPERLCGGTIDGRSDIFAAGVMMFELLTGSLPFSGDEMVLINRLLNERHPPLSTFIKGYPAALDAVIDRALQKTPDDRYGTAEEMAADLSDVIELVKTDHVFGLLEQARFRLEAQEPIEARALLIEALKLDNQQTQARRMLADLNQQISRKQQMDHGAMKRQQSQQAVLERNFDLAVAWLEEACKLLPHEAGVIEELDIVRKQKTIHDQITHYLQQANEAKRIGNISAARAIVQQALALDATNSRVRTVFHALEQQMQSDAQRVEAKKLLQSAKEDIAQRNYEGAFAHIRQAEKLDSANSDLHGLMSAAQEGIHRELRRGMLDAIEKKMATATDEEACRRVLAAVEAALERLPNDPLLVQYKLQLDQQMRAIDRKKQVEEAVQACRVLLDRSPEEAQARVRRALADMPGEERLLALASNIADQVARLREEERRASFLGLARTALANNDFAAATEILEQSQRECFSADVAPLLLFAWTSEQTARHAEAVARCHRSSRDLIDSRHYREAVSELQTVLQDYEDAGLRQLLSESQNLLDCSTMERDVALTELQSLMAAGFYKQASFAAIVAAERIPDDPSVVEIRKQAEAMCTVEDSGLQQVGRGYLSLVERHDVSTWTDGDISISHGGDALLLMRRSLAKRRLAVVNNVLQVCSVDLGSNDAFTRSEALDRAKLFLNVCGQQVRSEWVRLLLRKWINDLFGVEWFKSALRLMKH